MKVLKSWLISEFNFKLTNLLNKPVNITKLKKFKLKKLKKLKNKSIESWVYQCHRGLVRFGPKPMSAPHHPCFIKYIFML